MESRCPFKADPQPRSSQFPRDRSFFLLHFLRWAVSGCYSTGTWKGWRGTGGQLSNLEGALPQHPVGPQRVDRRRDLLSFLHFF